MKRITRAFIVLTCILAVSVFGQDQETLFSGDIEHGGFGGPVVMFSQVKGQTGVLVGGRGGWIINHLITLGGGGYGLVNKIPVGPASVSGLDSLMLQLGYGGFEAGLIFNSNRLVHVDCHVLIGAGGTGAGLWNNPEDFDSYDDNGDAFFVLEPSLSLILNMTPHFRIGGGVSYRYISGVDSPYVTDSDLSGPSFSVSLKFGRF